MAKSNIDPTALYKVDLAKSVRVGRLVINPSNATRLKGDALTAVIEQDKDAVKSFEVA